MGKSQWSELGLRKCVSFDIPSNQVQSHDRVYILDLSVSNQGNLIAAGSSANDIKIYDREHLSLLSRLAFHKDRVANVRFSSLAPFVLYSAAADGHLCIWDVRTPTPAAVMNRSKADRFCSMDVNCSDDGVVLGCHADPSGDQEARILIYDLRQRNVASMFSESHTDDVTVTQCHPSKGSVFATGSMDGLVCVFDLSADMSSLIPHDMVLDDEVTPEEKATLAVFNAGSSIAKIGFQDQRLFALSHCENLSVWDLETQVPSAKHDDLRAAVSMPDGCGQWDYTVDILQMPNSSKSVIVGGDHDGHIHLATASKDWSRIKYRQTLSGTHSSTIRCALFPKIANGCSLLTAGEDSMLCEWTDSQDLAVDQDRCNTAPIAAHRKRKDILGHSPFKPY